MLLIKKFYGRSANKDCINEKDFNYGLCRTLCVANEPCDPTPSVDDSNYVPGTPGNPGTYSPLDTNPKNLNDKCFRTCAKKYANSEDATNTESIIMFGDIDFDKDGVIGMQELLKIKLYYGREIGSMGYNPGFGKVDYNKDGMVTDVESRNAQQLAIDRCTVLALKKTSNCLVCYNSTNPEIDCSSLTGP